MSGKAIVIGAGIAGLSSGIALRSAGYDVAIYEQAPEIEPMGAALSLWANAMAALQSLDVADGIASEAAPIRRVMACTPSGRRLTRIDISKAYGTRLPTPYLPTRTLVQQALMGGLGDTPVYLGMKLASVSQTKDAGAVKFEDGTAAEADLIIMADGIWSQTANELVGNPPAYAGYGGVLALSDPVPGLVEAGSATEFSIPGERFGLFDLGDDRAYWFYMRTQRDPTEAARLNRGEVEARLGGWPAALMAAVRATPEDRLIPFSVHAKAAPRRLGKGRIICVGDAAHAMQPNFGQGGCQALEDAVALGEAAKVREPGQILPLFEAMRLKRIAMFVNGSRAASLVSQADGLLARTARFAAWATPDALVSRRLAAMHQMPDYEGMARR